MRRLWLCLAISLLGHMLLFPGFLQAMMASGAAAASKQPKTPPRVQISLVAPKKPKPEVMVRKPVEPKVKEVSPPAPKPAPKVEAPKPAPKVEAPKPVEQPLPKPPAAEPVKPAQPVAPAPTLPQPKPAQPAARPSRPAPAAQPASRPARSNQRLASTAPARNRANPIAVPSGVPGDAGGRAGLAPPDAQEQELPVGSGDGSGDGNMSGSASTVPAQPSEPRFEEPPRRPEPPAPSTPKDEPPAPPSEKTPAPDKRLAASTPKMREASIEVPMIRLPASLRRDALKTTLQVRVAIETNGQADFKLAESSGNREVDDYVLEQLRKVAVVTTALDNEGRPKKVVRPLRVDIEVD